MPTAEQLHRGILLLQRIRQDDMEDKPARIVRMRDIQLDESLFRNYLTGTVLDELLCSYKGLPRGVNYMVIGDPGVGKTTIILDMLADI